jgi:hypothetical protein
MQKNKRRIIAVWDGGEDNESCFMWDMFVDDVTEAMGGRMLWRDDAKNMGWRNRTGYKKFKAADGLELIRAISPDTDCYYTFYKYYNGFKVRLSHHDAPMGEYHTIKPIKKLEE